MGSPTQGFSSQACGDGCRFPSHWLVNLAVAVSLNPHLSDLSLVSPYQNALQSWTVSGFKAKTTLLFLRHFAYLYLVNRSRYKIQMSLKI